MKGTIYVATLTHAAPTIAAAVKRKHAERILSYGPARAGLLALHAHLRGGWIHVDWELVREGLKGN